MSLQAGQIVHVRSRQYLVEEVVPPPPPRESDDTLVRLSCLEDDALGERLEVLWEREVGARALGESTWDEIASRGFDDPKLFSAYLHTLRWNCVTSTNPRLFQAPYRAGIEVKAYQLEPLRKALQMPRVGLFIADDVGLGKTIEAGLILRELLMRQKVRRVVISCPPSVVRQWQEEMEQRFGLTFVIYDRDFVAARRQERGYGVNPFSTHTRFILSHALLRDETYAAPLRDWLGNFSAGSMLILDEAHNAAPASGARYAVDSHLTSTVRELAKRFEHKLFLSATPHNGHSNSFAALLEILDPQRFCRGVPIADPKLLDAVMVRRLKSDLRELTDDFPERKILPLAVDNLPEDTPELRLSRLLAQYRRAREERLQDATKSQLASAMLVVTSLQKRLLSSIEAFASTLQVHRRAMTQASTQVGSTAAPVALDLPLLIESPGSDDERADVAEAEVQAEEEAEMTRASSSSKASSPNSREIELLDEMADIAGRHRFEPDVKVRRLIEWVKQNLCPDLGKPDARWSNRRVLIFTEYADTKRYLVEQLSQAIASSDDAERRIATFHGGMGEDARSEIKRAFNLDPALHPLRILIATDAAREGVNLQNHCADLFHFDVPWNPSRMEQRNGRIDRKLQREKVVRCHYFVLPQRAEDRVLDVLVRKTATIHKELGSLSPVIVRDLSRLLDQGIVAEQVERLAGSIEAIAPTPTDSASHVIQKELEQTRARKKQLAEQIDTLLGMLKESQDFLQMDGQHFRDAVSASLRLLGADPLQALSKDEALRDAETARWVLPALDKRKGADPTWAATLDTLRRPRARDEKPWEWRKSAPIRPVVFRDPGTLDGEVVHLHLEHRVVQRLLGRFLSQGFLHHELVRACVCLIDEATPHVLALGRLSLYGPNAARLHDEVLAVAAPWTDPIARGKRKLSPLPEGQKDNVMQILERALQTPRLREVPESARQHFRPHAARDVAELVPHLNRRADTLVERARKRLGERGEKEAAAMVEILQGQKRRIQQEIDEINRTPEGQMAFEFKDPTERRQREADRRYWPTRLTEIEKELIDEPVRIRAAYEVKAVRVDPVGLIYLWPVSA
jgi:ERCC4-related helicase